MLLPESIQSLINALERLPGIGPKSASRLAFYLLRATEDVSQNLATALANLKSNTAFCQECFNITHRLHNMSSPKLKPDRPIFSLPIMTIGELQPLSRKTSLPTVSARTVATASSPYMWMERRSPPSLTHPILLAVSGF